jgi:hypothetical protein
MSGASLTAGLIIQPVSFTIGDGYTIATFRCLTSGAAVVGSEDPAEIGYWFLAGFFGGDALSEQALEITPGIESPEGLLFGVKFLNELDDLAPWTMSAPRVQSCIRGALGGTISGMIYPDQELGGFTSGAVPIIPNEGNPLLPPLLVVTSAVLYSSDTVEMQLSTTAGVPPDFAFYGLPSWLINGGNSPINVTSPGSGSLQVQFADPISSGDQLTTAAWDTAVRSTDGAWIPPLRVNL